METYYPLLQLFAAVYAAAVFIFIGYVLHDPINLILEERKLKNENNSPVKSSESTEHVV